ncbi:hypothetical protein FSARC_14973 [Fusarium sarcochroum]|uniref:Alpha/beta hydrolase fold-3 domain-containing protein n=1 Tax=Fusarium sarcochroum TaxID=1208366 RepID=A0A8H4WM72_9HYPO|nr:hypothetical protein FSARC_14973 [Fusarium sarcochroum]
MFNPDDLTRFDGFDIIALRYKTVGDHEITTHVLIPSLLTQNRHTAAENGSASPIILRFHGGGFVGSSSLFPDFFALWHMELALKHSAVIISPNYRLMPESSAEDMLSDVESLWIWLHEELPELIASRTRGLVRLDTSRIITAGDSAGGYLSVMLGLSHPDDIRAVTASYPMIDLKHRHFTQSYEKPMVGLPQIPSLVVDLHLDKLKRGEISPIISSDDRGERFDLTFAYAQHGMYRGNFPTARRELFPLDRLEDGANFPRGGVYIWHGKSDSVVPVDGSIKLAEALRRSDEKAKVHLSIQDGDHGFDSNSKLDDPWMSAILKEAIAVWLE